MTCSLCSSNLCIPAGHIEYQNEAPQGVVRACIIRLTECRAGLQHVLKCFVACCGKYCNCRHWLRGDNVISPLSVGKFFISILYCRNINTFWYLFWMRCSAVENVKWSHAQSATTDTQKCFAASPVSHIAGFVFLTVWLLWGFSQFWQDCAKRPSAALTQTEPGWHAVLFNCGWSSCHCFAFWVLFPASFCWCRT